MRISGASLGNNKAFEQATIKLAQKIVAMELSLIYGGSSLGMMGLLATTVKSLGGKAIGVMTTDLLNKEKPLEILDELQRLSFIRCFWLVRFCAIMLIHY